VVSLGLDIDKSKHIKKQAISTVSQRPMDFHRHYFLESRPRRAKQRWRSRVCFLKKKEKKVPTKRLGILPKMEWSSILRQMVSMSSFNAKSTQLNELNELNEITSSHSLNNGVRVMNSSINLINKGRSSVHQIRAHQMNTSSTSHLPPPLPPFFFFFKEIRELTSFLQENTMWKTRSKNRSSKEL